MRFGELALAACARRTAADLSTYDPPSPAPLRDRIRVAGQRDRCARCGHCPATIATLTALDAHINGAVEPLSRRAG
jgi:hypothetical protein